MPQTVEQRNLVKALREKRRFLSERVKRLKVIEEGQKTDFWNALKEEMELSAKSQEAHRDDVLDDDSMDPIKAWGTAKSNRRAARAYRGTIQMVEQASDRIGLLQNQISEVLHEMKKYNDTDGDTTGGNIV